MDTRLVALLGVLEISFSAVFVRLASVSPATAALYRMCYALPFLGLLVLVSSPDDSIKGGYHRGLAILSGILFAADLILFHISIAWIGAGLATVLANTQVLYVALFGWIIHGEHPRRRTLLLLPVILAGIMALSGLGGPAAYGVDPVMGTLAGTGSGLLYAGFLIAFREATLGIDTPLNAWFVTTLTTGVVCLGYGAFLEETFTPMPTWPAHGWLFLLAMVVQIAGWLMITRALPRLPALETSLLIVLQPVFTLIWGWLLFDERLSLIQGIGVIIVVGGVMMLVRSGAVRKARDVNVNASEPK